MPTYQCQYCEGRGYPLEMGEETCYKCAGTGRDNYSDLLSEPCIICNNRRKISYCRRSLKPCHRCNGSGITVY